MRVASAWRGLSGKKTPKMKTGFLWSMGRQASPGKEADDHQPLSGGVLGRVVSEFLSLVLCGAAF